MRRSLAALALAVVLPLPGFVPAAALADVVVKPGETLSEIAERHGVSLTRLMQANGIKDAHLVVAGQRLVLPGARSSTASRPTGGSGGTITVKPGETLSEIAERQGVSLTRLMQANGISDANLVVAGQKLVLPGSRSSGSSAGSGSRSLPTAPYTVKSGETLSEIADRFGTSTERLTQINGIRNPNLVVAGTRLAIPGRPASAGSQRTTPAPRNAKEHVVRDGESLSTIADSYGVSMNRLIAINKIADPDLVVSGTRLKLQAPPPVRTATTQRPAQSAPAKPSQTPVAQRQPQPKPQPQARTQPEAATATIDPGAPFEQVGAAAPARTTTAPTTTLTAAASGSPSSGTTTPVRQATSTATRTPAATTTRPTTTPATTATATTRPTTGSSSKPQGAEWRSYGPLQVDWANWQPMGGSYVAPTLNGDGKPVYLAVNCGARKLNATSQSGQWKSWDAPQTDFEEQLISDICKARAS